MTETRSGLVTRRFRVIQGGKKVESDTGAKTVLYRAHSVGDLTRNDAVYYDVTFHWYCLERNSPPLDYELAIADYSELDGASRNRLERDVSRCFTGDELTALDAFLSHKYGMGVTREEVVMPLKGRVLFFEEENTVIYDFLELSEKKGYSLSFKVWGYYTLRGAFSSKSRDNGARYLRTALDLLKLGSGVSDTRLEEVAKTLHDEESLVVERILRSER